MIRRRIRVNVTLTVEMIALFRYNTYAMIVIAITIIAQTISCRSVDNLGVKSFGNAERM